MSMAVLHCLIWKRSVTKRSWIGVKVLSVINEFQLTVSPFVLTGFCLFLIFFLPLLCSVIQSILVTSTDAHGFATLCVRFFRVRLTYNKQYNIILTVFPFLSVTSGRRITWMLLSGEILIRTPLSVALLPPPSLIELCKAMATLASLANQQNIDDDDIYLGEWMKIKLTMD